MYAASQADPATATVPPATDSGYGPAGQARG